MTGGRLDRPLYNRAQITASVDPPDYHQSITTRLPPEYYHQSITTRVLPPEYYHPSITTRVLPTDYHQITPLCPTCRREGSVSLPPMPESELLVTDEARDAWSEGEAASRPRSW